MRHAWLFAVALAGCAGHETVIPDNLRFPAGETAVLHLKATGAQIYDCKASAQDAAKFEWALRAPDAELRDTTGGLIGKHYGGPTWEALDGSKVVGELRARADAPDPDAIPWLLLAAKSTAGSGRFAHVRNIQRIETVGGKAPPACGAADVGRTLRVPYSATYVFTEAR